ncbi:MAG: hypothetical protein Dbin4_02626 [Alphaproteobacteria bacterium]|nr:hypothetical protein [Alphaproteobacteria bacterium]
MTDAIPLTAQIIEVAREIGMRQRVYPRRVADGKMSQAAADSHIAAMRAVTGSLGELVVVRAMIKSLCNMLHDIAPEEGEERAEVEALIGEAGDWLDSIIVTQSPELPL